MNKSEVKLRRIEAIKQLQKISDRWSDFYTPHDYVLDQCLRQILGKPEKSLGKPPYDWIELCNHDN